MARSTRPPDTTGGETGIKDGFGGQRLLIVPGHRVKEVAALPLRRDLRVTHLGQFREARRHLVTRPKGAAEHVWIDVSGQHHSPGAVDLIVLPAALPTATSPIRKCLGRSSGFTSRATAPPTMLRRWVSM
jgi:hypothetical protein